MRRIKYYLAATALSLSTSFMQSCSIDDNIDYITEMGTVSFVAESNSEASQVTGDEFGVSYLTNGSSLKYTKTDSVGQRILYTYCIEDNTTKKEADKQSKREIRIYDMYKVLTKNMDTLSKDQTDEFGKDHIGINWMYVSTNHLNIQFTIGRDNPSIAHRISLVALEGAKPDENGVLDLDLRHNQYKDIPYHRVIGYVSYTLESIPGYKEGTLKKIIINCQNTSTETSKYEIVIKKESSKGIIQKSTTTTENSIC